MTVLEECFVVIRGSYLTYQKGDPRNTRTTNRRLFTPGVSDLSADKVLADEGVTTQEVLTNISDGVV